MGRPPPVPPTRGALWGLDVSAAISGTAGGQEATGTRPPPAALWGSPTALWGAQLHAALPPFPPPQPTACASVSPFAHLGSQRGHPPTPPPAQWGPPHAIGTHRDPPPQTAMGAQIYRQWGPHCNGDTGTSPACYRDPTVHNGDPPPSPVAMGTSVLWDTETTP